MKVGIILKFGVGFTYRCGIKCNIYSSCEIHCVAERSPLEETEKSLQTLIKLSMNPECIGSLLEGLTNCIQAIMVVSSQSENTVLEQLVSKLLGQIIQVTTCFLIHIFI